MSEQEIQEQTPEAPPEKAIASAETAAEQPTLPGTIPDPDERVALLEAIVYVAEEPLSTELIAETLGWPEETVEQDLARLVEECAKSQRGIEVRKVAGGYKMFTKAEHHEAVRNFVKSIRPKLRLSLPALETLAVIAYKQPITAPEVQAIRGVQATGVLHTLLKHKLITTAGRKKVVGKPMMYKTTREFLVQFGLDDLAELPSLKELEEISRAALGDEFAEEADEVEEAQDGAAKDGEAQEDASEEAGEKTEASDAEGDGAVAGDSEEPARQGEEKPPESE